MVTELDEAPARHGPAFLAMAFDVQQTLLGELDDPVAFGCQLTRVLRELTGARTVVAARSPADGGVPKMLHVEPARRREECTAPAVTELLEAARDLDAASLWSPAADGAPPARRLARLCIGPSIAVPLRAGEDRVGALLLLDLLDLHAIEQVVDVMQVLSSVIALALRGALLLGDMHGLVDERSGALRQSEARFRTMAERCFDAILITDLDGTLTYASPALERILGVSSDAVVGAPLQQVLHPEDVTQLEADIRSAGAGEHVEARLLRAARAGGGYAELELNIAPVEGVEGIVGLQAIARDVTERRLAERTRARLLAEREQLAEQLRQSQKMEAVGRLAGGIAHDFNNLLTVILTAGELVSEKLPPAGALSADLDEILHAARRAETLTRQLLAFSRRQVMRPVPLDLNELLANLDRMLRRLIGEDIDLVTVLAPELGRVEADPGQIEQVIMNLAINARDAMPEGGALTLETAEVELDAEYAATHVEVVPGRYVMLAVTDTGEGMDEATRRLIFEPFFTTKAKGKGTGLGLATVHGIVRQSGGHVWVYSEPGEGTCFKIYLPRFTGDTGLRSLPPEPCESALGGPETILVVEDEHALLRLTTRVLRRQGYTVLPARDARAAQTLAAGHEGGIDLLLTDVVLPGPSGRQIAEVLEAQRPGLTVIYMSGYTDNAIIHHGVLEEGTRFIEKPFTSDVLLRAVRGALDATSRG